MKTKKQTKAQRRVALARDVLAQFRKKKLEVAECGYACLNDETGVCGVCAAGALAVACCGADEVDGSGSPQIRECLVPTFTLRQLGLIEAAFEQRADGLSLNYIGHGTPAEQVASGTYPADSSREYRLTAIMRNIIRNNGEFRP